MSADPFRAQRRMEMAFALNAANARDRNVLEGAKLIATIVYDDEKKTIEVVRAANTLNPRNITMKTATKRTTRPSAGKKRLQNTVRRSRGQKLPTRIKLLALDTMQGMNDGAVEPVDVYFAMQRIADWAGQLDGRRGYTDPSQGGKAV